MAVALGAGVCGGIQPKVNAALGDRLGSSLLASLVNFLAAFVVVLVALSLRARTRHTLRRIGTWPVPRWTLAAGLGGAVVVLSGVVAAGEIGVAVFSVAFFAGQIACGLVVDRLGIGPGGVRAISGPRAQAAGIALVAVLVSQLGRSVGELRPALVAFVVGAGAASAIQSACNGRITIAVGDPAAATAVNVTVGLVALATTAGVAAGTGRFDALHWPSEPWLYAGGVLGVTVVLSLAISTAALGVLRATLAMLCAQLITAFVVDWIVQHDRPTPAVVAGAALIVLAVARVGQRTSPRPALRS